MGLRIDDRFKIKNLENRKNISIMPELKDDKIIIKGEEFVVFLSEETLQKRIKELGKQISSDYEGKVPVFIGVLNGAVLFLSDLIKNVNVDCEIDFFKLSSYGDEKISSGKVNLSKGT